MKIFKYFVTSFLSLMWVSSFSQNFTVTNFEESLLDVISTNVKDKNGNDCAVIKFSTEDKGFSVDDAINSFENLGDFYVYIPEGTEAITIRHRVHRTINYRIPIHIQSGCHYTATINIIDKNLIGKVDPDKYLYANLGMNIIPFMGPEFTIGYNFKSFCAELGFIYGFNQTGDIYYYGSGAAIQSAFNYKAMRVVFRLGYSIPLTRQVTLTPEVGIAYNNIYGKEIKDITASNSKYMNGFSTLSSTFGTKLLFSFNSHLGLCVTPEYDLGVSKEDNYEHVKNTDSKLKAWTDGFCLSVALIYKF